MYYFYIKILIYFFVLLIQILPIIIVEFFSIFSIVEKNFCKFIVEIDV